MFRSSTQRKGRPPPPHFSNRDADLARGLATAASSESAAPRFPVIMSIPTSLKIADPVDRVLELLQKAPRRDRAEERRAMRAAAFQNEDLAE